MARHLIRTLFAAAALALLAAAGNTNPDCHHFDVAGNTNPDCHHFDVAGNTNPDCHHFDVA